MLGCPIGAMTSELIGSDPMLVAGQLGADADRETLALATFACLQGGLLLAQSM
jgi:hypothetical protein